MYHKNSLAEAEQNRTQNNKHTVDKKESVLYSTPKMGKFVKLDSDKVGIAKITYFPVSD